ncbi:MAG: hypothetical protein R8K46_03745 [Mariprofundaceae bacterium]
MTKRPSIAVYISGHGFGHLAQIAPVLQRLRAMRPDITLILRTSLAESVLEHVLGIPFHLEPGEVDVGVVQKSAIEEDAPATMLAARSFFAAWNKRIENEEKRLAAFSPALMLSDISPLAFPLAKRLGVPGIGLCSLDWHDIYTAYFNADDPVMDVIARAHADCVLLLKPPLSMPMQSFPRRQDIGLIARRARHKPEKVRQDLGIAPDQPLALVMFGGAGRPAFNIHALAVMRDWQFLIPDIEPASLPANVRPVGIGRRPYTSVDLIAAADVVVTKPGYATLAECWAAGCPVAYVPRPAFLEYPYLRDCIHRHGLGAELALDSFRNGDWLQTLETARGLRPDPYPVDGAHEAAMIILDHAPEL